MKYHYRILRYGKNGYKAQRSRDWVIFGKKYRGSWHNLKDGCIDVSWVAIFKTIEGIKKRIAEEVEREMNKEIGWRVVNE